jgi:cytochrome c-type biogenesis protein CcmH
MIAMILTLVLVSPVSLTTTQTAEISKVEKRLLAPCCYTQSIAEHGSDIAVQMRNEVAEMVADGQSEKEIVDHYRSIYGDRILIVPDGLTGRILFSLPVAISILACLVLYLCFRKMLRSGTVQRNSNVPQSRSALSDALREKIEREIGDSV